MLSLDYDSCETDLLARFPGSSTEITNLFIVFHTYLRNDRQAATLSSVDTSDVVDMVRTCAEAM